MATDNSQTMITNIPAKKGFPPAKKTLASIIIVGKAQPFLWKLYFSTKADNTVFKCSIFRL